MSGVQYFSHVKFLGSMLVAITAKFRTIFCGRQVACDHPDTDLTAKRFGHAGRRLLKTRESSRTVNKDGTGKIVPSLGPQTPRGGGFAVY